MIPGASDKYPQLSRVTEMHRDDYARLDNAQHPELLIMTNLPYTVDRRERDIDQPARQSLVLG